MMKKTCIIATLLVIPIILISIIIKNTYSKYSNSGELDINGNTGRWAIKVNEQDITKSGGTSQELTIEDLNYTTSEYVNPGKIASGLLGDFVIAFDTTYT